MPPITGYPPWFCLLLVLAVACADLPGLLRLRGILSREYPAEQIGVRLVDQSILTITFVDSPLLQAPCESRVGRAIGVAAVLRDRYEALDSMQVISVDFAPQPVADSTARTVAHYPIRFPVAAIRRGLGPDDSLRAVGNCKSLDELDQQAP